MELSTRQTHIVSVDLIHAHAADSLLTEQLLDTALMPILANLTEDTAAALKQQERLQY